MKTKKGFIQIPLFITIITGVLILGGGGYLGIKKYQSYSAQKPVTENSISNINKYMEYVGYISCNDGKGNSWSGSGSIWKYDSNYQFLTNYHVIEGAKGCQLIYSNPNNSDTEESNGVFYDLDIDNALVEINDIVDYAIIKLKKISFISESSDEPPSVDKNFTSCPKYLPLATSVFVIGFPATTQTTTQTQAGDVTSINLTVTNGIISSYDDNPTSTYPDYNYFITAKIDSGNSGGLAIAGYKNNLCVMGIPTAVKLGNYEIQGMIQSINNIINISDLPILENKKARNIALNKAPIVTLSVNPTSALAGTTFLFTAKATDSDNDELEYRIDLDDSDGLNWDENFSARGNVQKWDVNTTKYNSPGIHRATVEVRDRFGKIGRDTVTWQVF
ncbi:hypothetical protein A2906_02960 [Candidatus Nomurabacteria bacterium RIFCSPLOWO2_01_FULL_37_25]|nr:MAG: hypothetical protein A2640_01615 [Candidatus Nomurabacteria bacterium RIFCSPHIGHO2_01_FULL_36_23]OGI88015.1 MAG: hypothetical protein A2906_02960 [Candidatus Nomurabacteria bacterium RIFCSPLOWO2_01_FULL_37_25]